MRADIPDWLVPAFRDAFGERWLVEAEGLADRPTLDLRANTIKAGPRQVVAALARSGGTASPIAPNGVRIPAGEGPSAFPMSRRTLVPEGLVRGAGRG